MGRHRVTNRDYDMIRDVAMEARKRDSGSRLFAALRSDSVPATRLWAARYSLDLDTLEAERVLKEIAEGAPGPLRLTAEMTLAAWSSGALDVLA